MLKGLIKNNIEGGFASFVTYVTLFKHINVQL